MLVYHFLYDLYIFGVMAPERLFGLPLHLMQQFICWSFILLAGMSARFSRNNLRHGLIVLGAGLVVEIGAAVAGQTIRWGVLMLLGSSMVIWHFLGRGLQRLPGWSVAAGSGVLFFASGWWTKRAAVSAGWLYPLGFTAPGFFSADYFPLLPWFFLFLLGTGLGGWCLRNRENRILTTPLPKALTWPGRHSLMIYVLHQPVLYGIGYLIWG